MLNKLRAYFLLFVVVISVGATDLDNDADGDWIALFDGKTLAGWRGYRGAEVTGTGWSVSGGVLSCDQTAPKIDLISEEQFENYELIVEWKTVPDGNGGIFIHADESTEKLPFNAPEIQLHAAGKRDLEPKAKAGALYGLYPAVESTVKEAGEWNRTRIVADGPVLEVSHNGVLTCKTEIGGEDWKARIAAGKFNESPGFGTRTKGHIGLQDYGREIWFRSIRLRRLR